MKAINAATSLIISLFQKKSDDLGPGLVKGHPYLIALGMAKVSDIKPDLGNEKFVEVATSLLRKWAKMTVGDMGASCLNEIGHLGNLALKAGGELKKASDDLLSSMDFVNNVFTIFIKSVDYDHVAEWLLEDGNKKAAATDNLDELVQPLVIETPDDIDSPQKLMAFLKQQVMKTLAAMPDVDVELESASEAAKKKPAAEKPSDKPPVTPEDIVKLLFENRVKPSAN